MGLFSKKSQDYDPTVPRCTVCDVPFYRGKWDFSGHGFCDQHGYTKGYRGPKRSSPCDSCLNCVGRTSRNQAMCAANLYQMADRTWYDRWNRKTVDSFINMGMNKVTNAVKPTEMIGPQFNCVLYTADNGKTRDQVRIQDPLYFFSKRRIR